jgi:ArsR family transcriptional regulator
MAGVNRLPPPRAGAAIRGVDVAGKMILTRQDIMMYWFIMKKQTRSGRAGIPVELLDRMAQRLRLLAHADRLRIVEILAAEGAAPVHLLVERLGLPQGATSQHLNQMRRMGLLIGQRKGREVWYRIGDPRSLTILECIRSKGEMT